MTRRHDQPQSTPGTPLRPVVALVLVASLLTGPGCGVNRAEERTLPPPAALPNLRRASEALQQRIAREKEHVEAFSQELDGLRAQEERLYAEIVDAEETYQRLQGDADAAQDEVRAIDDELAAARRQLDERKAELERTRLEQSQADADLAAAQEAVLATRAGTTSWIARRELAEQQLQDARAALEAFRVRWRIPAQAWTGLLVQLGLGRLSLDPEAWEAPVSPLIAPPSGEQDAGRSPVDGDVVAVPVEGVDGNGVPAGDPSEGGTPQGAGIPESEVEENDHD